MYQKFTMNEAAIERGCAMECRDHTKNAASSKSQMSRSNFLNIL